jgi:hypothetical protein
MREQSLNGNLIEIDNNTVLFVNKNTKYGVCFIDTVEGRTSVNYPSVIYARLVYDHKNIHWKYKT